MVNPSIGRMVRRYGGTVGGYRVASTPEVGNGLIDGLILLIAAIANQAIDEGCECDGCQRWIQLHKDWGMEGVVKSRKVLHKAVPNDYWLTDYNE